MLCTKTNASVLVAGTECPYNPLKLRKTLFFENNKGFIHNLLKRSSMQHNCPLCNTLCALHFEDKKIRYYFCKNCYALFEDARDRPDADAEKLRYEIHDNNVEDKGYQKFVSPITDAILKEFTKNSKGLDFGAGKEAIISSVVQKSGYDIAQYDPFFHKHLELLERKYDYVACCEVIEHFYSPKKEFQLLKELLKPNAKLYCMTDIYNEETDFASWYYKNDPTHVFFYHKKTFEWIQKEFGFLDMKIEGRLVTFSN